VPTPSSAALVLSLSAANPGDKPLVLRAARSVRVRTRAAAATLRANAAASGVRGLADGALSASSDSRVSNGAPSNGAAAVPGDQSGAGQLVRPPVGKALGNTKQAVGATTDSLGRRLQGVTHNISVHVAPVGDRTGAVVQTVADRTNAVLVRLLRKR
jgi:hypothetical protein